MIILNLITTSRPFPHLVLRLLVDEEKVEVIVQHLVAIELWRFYW